MGSDGTADEIPPWKRPGALRRDYEPHRGVLLLCLGVLCLIFGIAVMYGVCIGQAEPQLSGLSAFGPALSLAGLGASVWVRKSALRDLGRMQRGEMDRSGAGRCQEACGAALGGIVLNGCFLPTSVGLCLKLWAFSA